VPFRVRRDPELEPDAIRAAHPRIHPAFCSSPQFLHEGLSRAAGVDVADSRRDGPALVIVTGSNARPGA